MNRLLLVLGTLIFAVIVFFIGRSMVDQSPPSVVNAELAGTNEASTANSALIRPYSPILGPENAPVTIVEFFDPACEACRAMHPTLTEIRKQYPDEVRIIMRYAAFHGGASDVAVRILETARLQGLFEPVLEALLKTQPQWASHSGAELDIAWEAAKTAGLDIDKARQEMNSADINNVLTQDAADIKTVNVRQTPTFFVDGLPLLSFGAKQLKEMVRKHVESARK